MSNSQNSSLSDICVGDFVINIASGTLLKDERQVKIEPQLFQFLVLLCQQHEESESGIVTRELMVDSLWSGKKVSDDAVRAVVKKLRDVLGDDARNPTYIKTIPTKGYRLVARLNYVNNKANENLKQLGKYALVLLFGIVLILIGQALFTVFMRGSTNDLGALPTLDYIDRQASLVSANLSSEKASLLVTHNQSFKQLELRVEEKAQQVLFTLPKWTNASFAVSENLRQIYVLNSDDNNAWYLHEIERDKNGSWKEKRNTNVPLSGSLTLNLQRVAAADQYLVVQDTADHGKLYQLSISEAAYAEPLMLPVTASSIGQFAVSPNKQYLAFAYVSDAGQYRLAIVEQPFDKAVLIQDDLIESSVIQMRWSDDAQVLVVSNINGRITHHDLLSGNATEMVIPDSNLYQVLGVCGEQCVYVASSDNSKSDIVEIPNPFLEHDIATVMPKQSEYANDLAVYSSSEHLIIFAQKQTRGVMLKQINLASSEEQTYRLPFKDDVTSLQISGDNEFVVGAVGQRIFLYRLANNSMSYISKINQQASFPTIDPITNKIYFSVQDEESHAIHVYDPSGSNPLSLPIAAVSYRSLDSARAVWVDSEKRAWLSNGEENEAQFITQLPSANPNHWAVSDKALYFVQQQTPFSALVEVQLSDPTKRKVELLNYTVTQDISLDKSTKYLLLTKSYETKTTLFELTNTQQ